MTSAGPAPSRVAVIGLDAAEWSYLESLMSRGDMPNLARLRDRSAVATLGSEWTWRAGRVWETFLVGRADRPSAIVFDPATYRTFLPGARLDPPFYADQPDLRLVALDVPYLTLAHDVAGAQVTAWGGHDAGYPRAARPKGLLKEIDERFGHHPAHLNDFNTGWHHAPSIERLADALVLGAARRAEISRWMTRNFEWDLFMTVMSEAHSSGEHFWHGVDPSSPVATADTAQLARDKLVEVHRAVDDAIGEIVRSLPPEAILIICSAHGMQGNDYDVTSMAAIPELLYRWHTGRPALKDPDQARWARAGYPPVTLGQDQKWIDYMQFRYADSAARRLRRAVLLAGGRPLRDGYRAFKRLRGMAVPAPEDLAEPIPPETDLDPAEIGRPLRPLDWQVACWYRSHWPRMKAFALPVFYDGRIRLNLRGRERDGVVDPSQYSAVCAELEALLLACRDPRTGDPVVHDIVYPRADDPMDPEAPDADLIVTWTKGVDAIEHPDLGMIGPFPIRRTGGHTGNGFALISGPGIEARDLGHHSALDLAPTILALLGRSPKTELEGAPILGVEPVTRT
jgi:predicted AlkP superfamily phosphohydrolase/phosphomutase